MFSSMRHAIFMLLCSALAGSVAVAGPKQGSVPEDFAARALVSGNYRLSEYRGDVVVLLFWGTWCGECRASLGDVDRIWRTYNSAGLMALGVNLDEKPEAPTALIKATGVGFPSIRDGSKKIARGFDVDALPMIVLLDREGRVRYAVSGARTGDPGTTDMIRRLLDE